MIALVVIQSQINMMKKCKCVPAKIAGILTIIGGINWGLVGIGMFMGSSWNLVNMIFGTMPKVEALIYLLVGISAVVMIFGCKCKKCMEGCATCGVAPAKTDSAMGGNM